MFSRAHLFRRAHSHLVAVFLISTSCALSAGGPEIDEFESRARSTQLVVVNFDGGTVSDCEQCSDAATMRSWAIGAVFKVPRVQFLPYTNEAGKEVILRTLEEAYAAYDILFTTERPDFGEYSLLMISPTVGPRHGVAPLDCGNLNINDIAFVYSISDNSTGFIARAAVHELGHSFGLSHVSDPNDFMHWDSSGYSFTVSDYDEAYPSGKCFHGGIQDPVTLLTGGLGARRYHGEFADDDDNPHEAAIDTIARADITDGCSHRGDLPLYCPDGGVTRGQLVAFIQRVFDLPDTPVNAFDDDDGTWYEAAANAAAAAGVMSGSEDRRFRGTEASTRGDVASMVARGLDLPPPQNDHYTDDGDSLDHDSINRLADSGLASSCGPSKFCPNRPLARDEMATFLAHALEY